MSIDTKIGWTHATVNFWWGCDEVSPACAKCYAREWAKFASNRLFGWVVEWGRGKPRAQRLEAARKEAMKLNGYAEKSGQRLRVFANSMSDWLDEEVPAEWLAFLMETIAMTPWLDWQLLTKRPENFVDRICAVWESPRVANYHGAELLHHFVEGWISERQACRPPSNVWVGTTVEDQERANLRIPRLLEIPARVRFLSCEPLLGAVDLQAACLRACPNNGVCFESDGGPERLVVDSTEGGILVECACSRLNGIHWVIAGGESGKGVVRPMHPDWVRWLRDQCAAASVPFFFKQWGEYLQDRVVSDHLEAGILATAKLAKGSFVTVGERNYHRVGTKAAGNTLDGVTHEAFPEVVA